MHVTGRRVDMHVRGGGGGWICIVITTCTLAFKLWH